MNKVTNIINVYENDVEDDIDHFGGLMIIERATWSSILLMPGLCKT